MTKNVNSQLTHLQGSKFRCLLTNDDSKILHSLSDDCNLCCVLHPDEGKKASFHISKPLQEELKECQSPTHLCLQAISLSSTDSMTQDTKVYPFVLGGFELISNSRVVEVYISEVKDSYKSSMISPITTDTYVTTCRGISCKNNGDEKSQFYKIITVLPGGPRKLTRFRIKLVSLHPSEEFHTKICCFTIKGRIILDEEIETSPTLISQTVSNHEASQSQKELPTFTPPGIIDVTTAAMVGMTAMLKATEEKMIDVIDSQQKDLRVHLQRVENALGMQGSVLQQLQMMIFQQNERILAQQMQMQEDLNDQQRLLKNCISILESMQGTTQSVQNSKSKELDAETCQGVEIDLIHSGQALAVIEDEDSKPLSKMLRFVKQSEKDLGYQRNEPSRDKTKLSTSVSKEVCSTTWSENCAESSSPPDQDLHNEDTSIIIHSSKVSHEIKPCPEELSGSISSPYNALEVLETISHRGRGISSKDQYFEDEDCKPASRSRSAEELMTVLSVKLVPNDVDPQDTGPGYENSFQDVSISLDTNCSATIMPKSNAMDDLYLNGNPLDGEEKKNDDDPSSTYLLYVSDEGKPSDLGQQVCIQAEPQSVHEPPDKGWGSPNSMLYHPDGNKAGEMIDLIDLS
jgi:hypothetical protein